MTSNQSISDIADFYGVFTFQDPLIYWAVEDHSSWKDREFSLRADHFVKVYIKGLDEELLTEKPIFTPDIFGMSEKRGKASDNKTGPGDSPLPEPSISSSHNVTEDWDNERYSQLITKFMNKSRVHSCSVVRLYDEPPYWRVFCEREITEMKYDKKGNPTGCLVEWSKSMPQSDTFISFKEEIIFVSRGMIKDFKLEDDAKYGLFIPFGSAPSEDELGEFDLEDKWSLAVNMRYCNLDITNNSAKSSGFYWLMYGSAIAPGQRQALVNALDLTSSSRAVGAKENVLKQLTAMFPSKPEFTLDAINEMKQQFAMACRLPLAYFRSESEKAPLFGDQSGEEIKINKKKRYIFAKFKPYIMDLIFMRWGIVVTDVEPFILETEEEEIEIPMDNESNQKDELNGSKIELNEVKK